MHNVSHFLYFLTTCCKKNLMLVIAITQIDCVSEKKSLKTISLKTMT